MKVSELAAELKKQNKDIINKAVEIGIDAKGATKNLSAAEAQRIREGFDESAQKAQEEKKSKLMPRRVPKAAVEAEKKAAEDAAAAAEAEKVLAEERAAAPPKPPVLAVAWKAEQEEAAALSAMAKAEQEAEQVKAALAEPEGPAAETDAETKTGDAAAESAELPGTKTETAVGPTAGASAAGEAPAAGGEIVSEISATSGASETYSTSAPSETPANPAGKQADGSKPAAAPDARTDRNRTRPDKKPKTAGTQSGAASGTPRASGTSGAACQAGQTGQGGAGDAAKKEDGAAKGKAKDKDKDKKARKGKDAKPGEAFQNGVKKKGVRGGTKAAPGDDFKGSKKSPIIEENSLEKRPVRAKPRPKQQPRVVTEKVIRLEDLAPGTFIVNVPITVAGLSEQIERSTSELIMALMQMGIMSNINQNLDEENVQLLAAELDVPIVIGRDEGEIIEDGIENFEDEDEDLSPRPPIITVMGHVDHGKTSLLDAIRSTNVTDKEAGGITQHIGASEVVTEGGQRIVFLDTPGHEAFTAMRARGAHVTDIAVLVVAADDGVMPQTIESISHAKAAGVPIIVAINKMDKEGANPDLVKKELSDNGVLVEEWGGDVISVPVSAKTGEGVTNLLEMILLQAEVLELRANSKRLALGTVIEARLDKSKGPLATLLVLNGILTSRMSIVAGTTSAKIRTMTDFKGKPIKKAGPATAVEITGFAEVPQAGDEFHALMDDKLAREIAETRRVRQREQVMARTSGTSLENLFAKIREGEIKELNVIIKADVMGSVGAIATSLEKIDVEGVKVSIIHRGVGTVTESDVMLASTSGAIILAFNVRPNSSVTSQAERENVEIRTYRVIYDVIDEVEAALKGMLDPVYREVVLGKAEIRETFKLPGGSVIGGAYVTEGRILRNAEVRLVRDGIVTHEGSISSLRRFKDDVREVATGYECGIGIANYNDIKAGDEVEAFKMEEIERD
ncbi:MAG: translation initiation factor IF-2 [Clostridiales Family XIII bacterium]|jgi:translation initiation factor IF-2|nr:translation initiation factor IF-2 [Clostridiales Family XIII bacterium]